MVNNNYEKLTIAERRKLKGVLRKEQGSMAAAEKLSGITGPTLNRAAAGMRLRIEKANTIRAVLLNQKLETISETELSEG